MGQSVKSARSCPLCASPQGRGAFRRERHGVVWTLAHCLDCGLYFTDPLPTRDQMAQFYSGDYHAELRRPGAAEKEFGAKFRRYLAWIASYLPSGRCLDVGCATGLFPHMLRQKGYEAEGLELNPASAAWGARHYGVPVRCGKLEGAGDNPGAYDLISMTDVVEHTADPLEQLRLARRLLRPGGYVLVTFPDIASIESRYYRTLSRLLRRDVWLTCSAPYHTWEFTPATAARCFALAGFEIAGFRRSQLRHSLSGKLRLLSLPVMPLRLSFAAHRWGTQMEFMLRRAAGEA